MAQTSIPNEKKAMDKQKCQALLWNLVEMLHNQPLAETSSSCAIIREIWQTQRCDKFHDLSEFRNDIRDYLNDGREQSHTLNNILDYNATERERDAATQCIVHYHSWAKTQILKGLSWPNYFYFHTLFKGERTLAVLGLTGSSFGVGKWLYKQGVYQRSKEFISKFAKKGGQ